MTLKQLIETRMESADRHSAGVPKANAWMWYYNGWKDAYKDLLEILTQQNFDLDQLVITNKEKDNN